MSFILSHIHTCVYVCPSGFLPGWLTCILLQKWLVKRSRTWGLSENSGSLSPFQPNTLIPYLSYILRLCLILYHARFLWLLVFEKAAYHIMVKEYILGDRRLTPNLVKLLYCLKFDQLGIHLRNYFLLRYCCPWGKNAHLLIPLEK